MMTVSVVDAAAFAAPVSTRGGRVRLVGRHEERREIERLLGDARARRSGALVLEGEPGSGKSALLEHARAAAERSKFRVARVVGMESEQQFAYAGLHQLCAPLLDLADRLAAPQRAALDVVFGRERGEAPDRFLIALAALDLLAEASVQEPLVCLVDDAQWLDPVSEDTIAFVARRLDAERVALLIATRGTEGRAAAFAGVRRRLLEGLSDAEAHDLLAAALVAPVEPWILDRVVAEAHGNPLALLELPRADDPTRLASGFELAGPSGVPRRIEQGYASRSAALPAETRLLLLAAAADPTGDAALLQRATAELGLPRDAAAPAEAAGLLRIDATVRFRHPLVRSAIYGSASSDERRRAHAAIAVAMDADADSDRRDWHRGQAVAETDDEVAAALERSARRALDRGGMAAAAALLQRSAELTGEPRERIRRAMDAAQAKHEAGAPEDALRLLALAAAGPLDPAQTARIALYRALIASYLRRDEDIPARLLDAAAALAPLEPAVSRETYLLAVNASTISGGRAPRTRTSEVAAAAARSAPAAPDPPRPLDHLLDGMVAVHTRGYPAGVDALHRALAAFREQELHPERQVDEASARWLRLAGSTAAAVFDNDLMLRLARRDVARARGSSALATLHQALAALAAALVLQGDLAEAAQLVAECDEIARATRAAPLPYAARFLAAWQGRAAGLEDIPDVVDEPSDRAPHVGAEVASAQYSLAVLHQGEGDADRALAAAERAILSDEPAMTSLALPEVVEAAVRAGRHERAAEAASLFETRIRGCGTDWARGLVARSQALVSTGEAADAHFREAIEQLEAAGTTGYLARTLLIDGERLRREGRRRAARERLREAHTMLMSLGAEGFARRAARELRATGEQPIAGGPQRATPLTDHELHIARLVATGATSKEVATRLFLSPRTIDAHLRSIYRKLEITSRRELRGMRLP